VAFLERLDLWKCHRLAASAGHLNHLQQGQGVRPIYKNLNIMVFRALCLLEHDTIMVSNTIYALLLPYSYVCIYRIVLRPVLSDRNNCFLCKKGYSFINTERIKQWIRKK
jgi:hypothetical protein